MPPPVLTLRWKIVALTTALVLVSFFSGLVLLGFNILSAVEAELGRRAMSVARTVAQVELVKERLGKPDGPDAIQPVVERMRLATGVEYIVLFDMDRIRYSHPLRERIGTRFEGGDEGPALSQQAYVTRAVGVNGPSVRAFVPVLSPDGSEQVGVVVVGILVPEIWALLYDFRYALALALAAGLVVAVLGSWVLASGIKRQMFNLEPPEIAGLLEERAAIVSALGEGLLAVDRHGRITVMNDTAQQIIGTGREAIGRSVLEVVPHSRLLETIHSGRAEFDRQMLLGRTVVVVNRVPVRIGGQIVGAVATFRDRTDIHRLAEELTGVTRFVEALRAQNHESLNKLHAIAGMIQLDRPEAALDYIFAVTEQQQEVSSFLARNVNDYRVSGLLLGKVVRGRELSIGVAIDPESRMDGAPAPLTGSDLVLILGNLLENAMEALSGQEGERRIDCLLRSDAASLMIRVADNGPGVAGELQDRLFEQGVSSRGPGRGLGLALVRQTVAFAGGSVEFESRPGRTMFMIRVVAGGSEHGGNSSAAS